MADYETKFSDLMTGVKAQLLAAKNKMVRGNNVYPELRKAVTFKIGPLAPMAVFPAVVVVPFSEEITKRLSGQEIRISRVLQLYVYVKEPLANTARTKLLNLLREVREALQTDFQVKDRRGAPRVFRLLVGDATISEVGEMKQSILWEAFQPFTFISKETFAPRPTSTSISEVTQKRLLQIVEAVFESGKSFALEHFRQFVYWQVVPIVKFPSLAIVYTGESTDEEFAGRDTVTRNFEVYIWTRMSTKDEAILLLTDRVIEVRDYLHQNYRMRDKVVDTEIGTTTYGSAGGQDNRILQATIPFSCRCQEAVAYND